MSRFSQRQPFSPPTSGSSSHRNQSGCGLLSTRRAGKLRLHRDLATSKTEGLPWDSLEKSMNITIECPHKSSKIIQSQHESGGLSSFSRPNMEKTGRNNIPDSCINSALHPAVASRRIHKCSQLILSKLVDEVMKYSLGLVLG